VTEKSAVASDRTLRCAPARLAVGLTAGEPWHKKKEPSKRLSKVNREASNRGRRPLCKSRELDDLEVNANV
jgi:hypothetical protein